MNLPPHRPPDKEIKILAEGFFGIQGMILVEWLAWAISHTESDLPEVDRGFDPSLSEYYDYCKVLQSACIKYLGETT